MIPRTDEENQYNSKMKEVRKIEDFRREREEYGLSRFHFIFSKTTDSFILEENKSNPHVKDSFFQRLQFHVLRNVEITLSNVHLAYDDNTTKSYPFQFGITLQHFQLYVCLFLFSLFRIEF